MYCNICKKKTPYPICAECAGDKELSMIKFLYRLDESIQIAGDRKKALFVYVMPMTRTMIFGLLFSITFIITAIYTPYKSLSSFLIPIGLMIFFIGWIIHPPLKTEAVYDYQDMTTRIVNMKQRKSDIIITLNMPSKEWTDYQGKLAELNVFTTSIEA